MIKTFEEFINENYAPNLTLILENHKFDSNPGEDFGENWEKLDKNDKIYKYVNSKLPKYDGTRSDSLKPGIMDVYKVPEQHSDSNEKIDCHYVAYIHGGENGTGNWENYFDYLKNLFSNFEDAWLMDLENDIPDDVWTLRLVFREK